MTTKKNLLRIKGLSETKVDKIKEAAAKAQVHKTNAYKGASINLILHLRIAAFLQLLKLHCTGKRWSTSRLVASSSTRFWEVWNNVELTYCY